mmetsp:Transcript_14841/g.30111  ORF Transcript_14841/g.30111 Transcript_14841/m.30111 type:complete len:243 (+) Transcript_14841:711-1439(+)
MRRFLMAESGGAVAECAQLKLPGHLNHLLLRFLGVRFSTPLGQHVRYGLPALGCASRVLRDRLGEYTKLLFTPFLSLGLSLHAATVSRPPARVPLLVLIAGVRRTRRRLRLGHHNLAELLLRALRSPPAFSALRGGGGCRRGGGFLGGGVLDVSEKGVLLLLFGFLLLDFVGPHHVQWHHHHERCQDQGHQGIHPPRGILGKSGEASCRASLVVDELIPRLLIVRHDAVCKELVVSVAHHLV